MSRSLTVEARLEHHHPNSPPAEAEASRTRYRLLLWVLLPVAILIGTLVLLRRQVRYLIRAYRWRRRVALVISVLMTLRKIRATLR